MRLQLYTQIFNILCIPMCHMSRVRSSTFVDRHLWSFADDTVLHALYDLDEVELMRWMNINVRNEGLGYAHI